MTDDTQGALHRPDAYEDADRNGSRFRVLPSLYEAIEFLLTKGRTLADWRAAHPHAQATDDIEIVTARSVGTLTLDDVPLAPQRRQEKGGTTRRTSGIAHNHPSKDSVCCHRASR